MGIVSGNAYRRGTPRLNPLVVEACRSCIEKVYLTRARKSLVETKQEVDKKLEKLVQEEKLTFEEASVSESTLRRLLGEIGVRPDRLGERRNAAIGDVNFRAYPVDNDVHGERRTQQTEQRRV